MSEESPHLLNSVLCNEWLEVLDELNIGSFTVNNDRQITAINHSAQALMGLKKKEVEGKDCREIFTGVPCMVKCMIGTHGKGKITAADVTAFDENNVALLITRIATPIYNHKGEIMGCLTILQDHSPIRDLIERLKYEERSLKYILDSLDVGVFTVNRGGLITFFNQTAEKISGFHRKEILGHSSSKIFESEGEVCLMMDAILKETSHGTHFGKMIDRDGVVIPIRAAYMALKNEKNKIIGGLGTFHDLSLLKQLDQAIHDRYSFHDMIGKSPSMQKIFEFLPVLSKSDATVLIEGATGTGKDLIAKIIHSESHRSKKNWVKVNCAAIPENLLESELFGYVKGAFTGADKDKPGRFQLADKGTIFLDEIGDMPLTLQAKLLRVIEDKEFYPLGGRQTQKVDVRILSATNRNLQDLVSKGQFREDLYYRLNVIRVSLPKLCERPSDLPLLIRHIIRRLAAAAGRTPFILSKETMKCLLNYHYPGNVRELENILEHAGIVSREETIEPEHLPDYMAFSQKTFSEENQKENTSNIQGNNSHREEIINTLKVHKWHRGKTAKALGMNRSTLWRKMREYHITR